MKRYQDRPSESYSLSSALEVLSGPDLQNMTNMNHLSSALERLQAQIATRNIELSIWCRSRISIHVTVHIFLFNILLD